MVWSHPLLLGAACPLFLAQDSTMISVWSRILRPEIIWIFIPVIAILSGAIISLVRRGHPHRERMAMIAAGMHPDFPSNEDPDEMADPNDARTMDYEQG